MSDQEELVFDVENLRVPVTIRFKDTGKTEKYYLTDASGGAAVQFKNAQMSGVVMDMNVEDGSKPRVSGVKNIADLEPLLVSLCLFHEKDDSPVPLNVVKSFPYRIIRALYDKAYKMSDFEEKQAKN